MILTAIFGNLLFGVGVGYVLIGEIDKSALGLRAIKEELELDIARRAQYTELQHLVLVNREAIKEVDAAFLDPEQDIDFIREIEAMTNRTSLTHTLTPLSFQSPANGAAFATSAITVEGTYGNVLRFLELLEHMRYPVTITNVSLQKLGILIPGEEGSVPQSRVRAIITFSVAVL